MMTTLKAIQAHHPDKRHWERLLRHLGKTERVVEATLELNPGLAAAGPILPAGMAITLPDHATMPAATRPTVNLWD